MPNGFLQSWIDTAFSNTADPRDRVSRRAKLGKTESYNRNETRRKAELTPQRSPSRFLNTTDGENKPDAFLS